VLIKYRGGREEYANRQRGYIPRELNMEPGEVWFADNRIGDFWVRVPHPDNPDEWLAVRPWVTAIQDARSGYMVAMTIYCDQAPNHERILETYQNAVIAAGWTLPRVWYHDQGKDYLKQGVVEDAVLRTHDGTLLCGPDGEPYRYSVMRALRVRDKPARGYNGKEKPVERGFGTEANDFDRTQPGYCGNAPGNRPDQRDTWEGDVMRLPTQEQARRQLDDWLRNEHHLREREDGKSIQDMWDGRPEAPEREVTERDLFMGLLMPHAQARKVDRSAAGTGGVRFAGWTYSHVSLRGWRGKNVMIKTYWGTPRVTRKRRSVPAGVFVYSPDDVLICLAVADGTADMIADTEEAKARLGELQHLINASAKLDTDEFEQHTGTRRLGGADGVMRMLPAWGGTGGAAVVADAQNTRPARRVKGRPAARPAIAAPAEDISDFHAAINEAARLQQDDDRADAPLEFPGAAPAGRQEQGQPAEADGFLGGLMNAEQEDDPYAD